MSIGGTIRRMFGPYERVVSELWRTGFINLDQFFEQVRAWVPKARSILEIGCGEGAGTERLASSYPDASILAIDISPNIGRLYRGRRGGVTFSQVAVTELADAHPSSFDLIVMCDVLHHIPSELRPDIVAAAHRLLAPGGSFICKDWARTATPIHWLAHAADRWLTGDRVRFATPEEAEALLADGFGTAAVRARATIGPWRNNFALLLRPSGC